MNVALPSDYLQAIRAQAQRDYPNETCGILIGPVSDKEKITDIFPCKNVQDPYHAEDPVNFPRTARTAYFIDPAELLKIQKAARGRQSEMRVIYHSHVDAGAYFSEDDQRIALSEGEPAYPGVSYLVVSVMQGQAGAMNLFTWARKEGVFQGLPVR